MERFLLKEFSKNPTVATSVYGSKSAGNPQYTEDYEQMQSLVNWEQGLGGATNNGETQPNLNDIQAVYKVLCKAIKNNQVSGLPLYLDTETYQIGSIVLNVEKGIPYIYYSKVADNIGNPLNDINYWEKIYLTQELFYPDVDYTDGNYIVGTSPYTCPVSGILILNFNITTIGQQGYFSLQVNNSQVAYFDDEGIVRNCFSIPVSKGDEIVVNTNATSSVLTIYPYKQQKSN